MIALQVVASRKIVKLIPDFKLNFFTRVPQPQEATFDLFRVSQNVIRIRTCPRKTGHLFVNSNFHSFAVLFMFRYISTLLSDQVPLYILVIISGL